jgi:hypothetical protein
MNGDASQQQLLSNSTVDTIDATINEETPFTDHPPEGEEEIQSAFPQILEWSTSTVSQVRIYTILLSNVLLFFIDMS